MKNPVAYEVPVMATGARPGASGSQRELFTEEASTVLVFENGGMIRLSAAVTVGQLLFLPTRGTNREVVAQVMRKRGLPADELLRRSGIQRALTRILGHRVS